MAVTTPTPAGSQRSVEAIRRFVRLTRLTLLAYCAGLVCMMAGIFAKSDLLYWAGLAIFTAFYLVVTWNMFRRQLERARAAEPLPADPTPFQRADRLMHYSGWLDISLQVAIMPTVLLLFLGLNLDWPVGGWMPVFFVGIMFVALGTAVNTFLTHKAFRLHEQAFEQIREQSRATLRAFIDRNEQAFERLSGHGDAEPEGEQRR